MRIPLLHLFMTSPFDGLLEHAEKVKECAWVFQQAIECHIAEQCTRFEDFKNEVDRLEHEADSVKRRIRGHIPKGTLMPVDKFQLFRYLGEQDSVLDAAQDALDWISFRFEAGVPKTVQKDLLLLVDSVIDPIEELIHMVSEARTYFKLFSDKQRVVVKDIIRNLRKLEHESDQLEDVFKQKVFHLETDPITVFHMVRLAEIIGSIADHAENAGDMMRAMVAR
ncbi:MAG: TIGR00153 family protein [Deltaproteobacteria bacterium RBG_13_49_15]|nr:MAG: TIGR00153 family protein [Deltaproteobacteria bacterium RBG_13_49_15]